MTIRIFVISLLDSPRRAQISTQFKHYNIPFTFIDATDGRALSDTQKSHIYDNAQAHRAYRTLTDGEIGCADSHKRIYQKMMDDTIHEAIVLEDDVILTDNFIRFLHIYKTLVPKDADFLHLGPWERFHSIQRRFKWIFLKSTPFRSWRTCSIGKCYNIVSGTFAYYINARGAKTLLKMQSPKIVYGADFITGDMLVTPDYTPYMIYPPIVVLNQDIESVIDPNNTRKSLPLTIVTYNTYIRFLILKIPFLKAYYFVCRNRKIQGNKVSRGKI